MTTTPPDQGALLREILATLQAVQSDHGQLSKVVQNIEDRLDTMAGQQCSYQRRADEYVSGQSSRNPPGQKQQHPAKVALAHSAAVPHSLTGLEESRDPGVNGKTVSPQRNSATGTSSRIILTTYPGQSGIDPIAMNWGHSNPIDRGPVVVSRSQSTIRRRNGTRLFTYEACHFALGLL